MVLVLQLVPSLLSYSRLPLLNISLIGFSSETVDSLLLATLSLTNLQFSNPLHMQAKSVTSGPDA